MDTRIRMGIAAGVVALALTVVGQSASAQPAQSEGKPPEGTKVLRNVEYAKVDPLVTTPS